MKAVSALGMIMFWSLSQFLAFAAESLDAQILLKIHEENDVYEVAHVNRTTWVATENGAYQMKQNDVTGPTPTIGITVRVIADVNGETWFGSEYGIFRIDPTKARPALIPAIGSKPITAIHFDGKRVWIGTRCAAIRDVARVSECGLFLGQGQHIAPDPIIGGETVHTITGIGNDIWIGTDTDVYRIRGENISEGFLAANTTINDDLEIYQIAQSGQSIWLVTGIAEEGGQKPGPCLEIINGREGRTVPKRYRTLYVADIMGKPWFATMHGVVTYVGGNIEIVKQFPSDEAFGVIAQFNDSQLLGSSDRLWISDTRSNVLAIPSRVLKMKTNFYGVTEAEGSAILWGGEGVYELREDIDIRIDSSVHKLFGQNYHIGKHIAVSVAYERSRSGYRPVPDNKRGRFQVAISEDSMVDAHRMLTDKNTMAAGGSFRQVLSKDVEDIFIVTHDSFGNMSQLSMASVIVLPAYVKWGIITELILLPIFSVIMICAAPYFKPAMYFSMNSIVRNALSGGWYLILMGLPFVQRHLMKRYRRNLVARSSRSSIENAEDFHANLKALAFAKERVYFCGMEADNMAFLRSLCRDIATGEISLSDTQVMWPVYLDLDSCGSAEGVIESSVLDILGNVGGLTDRNLARVFVSNGGFVFLFANFPGIENRTEPKSLAVYSFVRKYDLDNRFILTTARVEGYSPQPGEILLSGGESSRNANT